MFVFKAAVVGAGVMGGEIAQVIASADVPVLLKDVDQRFVDAGLAKAREVTQRQVATRLGVYASFVSRCESGERRLDVVELEAFCAAYDVDLISFLRSAGFDEKEEDEQEQDDGTDAP